MLPFILLFFCLGLAVATTLLTMPNLQRLFTERPEVVLAVWPTSPGLMLADSLGSPAVIITVLQNGMLYGLLGSALWLLVGPISIRNRPDGPASSKDGREPTRAVRRYAYRVLGCLSLALSPLTLVALYLGDMAVRVALLVSTVAAIAVVARQPVFPFSHLLNRWRRREFQAPLLVPLESQLDQARRRSIIAVSGLWIVVELWVTYVGWKHGWTDTEQWAHVGWPIAILWVAAVVSISLAATSALLWLSFYLVADWRRNAP